MTDVASCRRGELARIEHTSGVVYVKAFQEYSNRAYYLSAQPCIPGYSSSFLDSDQILKRESQDKIFNAEHTKSFQDSK